MSCTGYLKKPSIRALDSNINLKRRGKRITDIDAAVWDAISFLGGERDQRQNE
jgi:hypothetical protein